MTLPKFGPIPSHGMFTAWARDDQVDVLCRSADWYHLPAIQRYLYNMAACDIRMEDAKTETRVYTYDRYEGMRQMILRSLAQEWDVAFDAWVRWFEPDLRFGVVHLVKEGDGRGDIISGDDPNHVTHFCPENELLDKAFPFMLPSMMLGGGDL